MKLISVNCSLLLFCDSCGHFKNIEWNENVFAVRITENKRIPVIETYSIQNSMGVLPKYIRIRKQQHE